MGLKIGLLGIGLIGKQRLAALQQIEEVSAVYVFDPVAKISSKSVFPVSSIEEFFSLDLDKVVISTPHIHSYELSKRALDRNFAVLLEKPMGINGSEARALYQHPNSALLHIGFNYRFMPAIVTLKKLLEERYLGEIHQFRMEVGHGGKPEDALSWKLDKEMAGGGALLDPGIHLIDLLLYLGFEKNNSFNSVIGWKGFWNKDIEESVSINGTSGGIPVQIVSSIVSWKTRFSIELIGSDKYVEISGRGRTDGNQQLIIGSRWGWKQFSNQKASEKMLVDVTKDESLIKETHSWLSGKGENASAFDGLRCMELYEDMRTRMELHELVR